MFVVHVGLALKPRTYQRRSQLKSNLKPYWGKPNVWIFREGARNVMHGLDCAFRYETGNSGYIGIL